MAIILKKMIKNAGLTQKCFAEIIGVATSTLNGYIISEREPNLQLLLQMADVLNVNVGEILGKTTVKTKEDILTNSENLLLKLYRDTEFDKKQALLEFAEFLAYKMKIAIINSSAAIYKRLLQ